MNTIEAIDRAKGVLDPARDAMLTPAQRAEELHAALADMVEAARQEGDELRRALWEAKEYPCPFCHTIRGDFRHIDQGWGDEDIDAAAGCKASTRDKPCGERMLRVKAEAEVARLRAELEEAKRDG